MRNERWRPAQEIKELSARFSLPYEEVENLLLHHFSLTRSALYLKETPRKEGLSFATPTLVRLLRQRREGYPVQYLTNTAFFFDLELYVDERVFIPRPETEGLVELVADIGRKMKPQVSTIVDIGTGSGNIAISLARLFPEASIFATDILESALEVTKINLMRYGLEGRVKLILSDLFSSSELSGYKFDFIVSNPPYIPSCEIPFLQREVCDFEPRIAIDGGRDGFFYIQRIIKEGFNFLAQEGAIFLEIDPRSEEKIERMGLPVKFYPDLCGRTRYAVIRKPLG